MFHPRCLGTGQNKGFAPCYFTLMHLHLASYVPSLVGNTKIHNCITSEGHMQAGKRCRSYSPQTERKETYDDERSFGLMSEKFGRNRVVRLWTTLATKILPKALKTIKKKLDKYFSLIFQIHLILSWKDQLALVTFSNVIFCDFIILIQNTLYPDNPISSICQAS